MNNRTSPASFERELCWLRLSHVPHNKPLLATPLTLVAKFAPYRGAKLSDRVGYQNA
jgi:hypothetical protein